MKKKVFVIFLIIAFVALSSGGVVFAYKKLAQESSPHDDEPSAADNPYGYGFEGEEDFEIRKWITKDPPAIKQIGGTIITRRGIPLNTHIWFKGKLDKNEVSKYADVMLLIDRSVSMKGKTGVEETESCEFTGEDPNNPYPYSDEGGDHEHPSDWNDTKMCWTIEGAKEFIDLAGRKNDNVDMRVGYVTYGSWHETRKEESSPHGWQGNAQYFKSLADMAVSQEKNIMNRWLGQIGFEAPPVGTAMGKATNFAVDELVNNGRVEVNGQPVDKYIILITDGVGNISPFMTGCASFRRTTSDDWPDNWPGNPPVCQDPPPGWNNGWRPGSVAEYVDNCCIVESQQIPEGYKTGWPFPGIREIAKRTNFWQSPVGKSMGNNIKIPTLGFGKGGGSMNPTLLRRIAAKTFGYADEWDLDVPYMPNESGEQLRQSLNDVFSIIAGDRGSPVIFQETLPEGIFLDVNTNLLVTRNIKDEEYCSPELYCRKPFDIITQGVPTDDNTILVESSIVNRRQEIRIRFSADHYSNRIGFRNQRFFIHMTLDTSNAVESQVDIDSNCDCTISDAPSCGITGQNAPSRVNWTFPLSGNEDVYGPTPTRCVKFIGSQYSGDVFGQRVTPYLFPGIDVLVSKFGINNVSGPIWQLENYGNFAQGSSSNFATFRANLRKQIIKMIERATKGSNLTLKTALRRRVDPDLKPEGEIFYVVGDQGIYYDPGGVGIGEGRRTVIVDGNVTIEANIAKSSPEYPALLIVLGDVTFVQGNKTVELGILAPAIRGTTGNINILDAWGFVDIEGFLIGQKVNLRSPILSDSQSIRYDEDLTLYPPPGLSELNLPIYWEVAP